MTLDSRSPSRPLRADAARNREKVLKAAAVVFAQQGLEATLDQIAQEAGVGVGTVYRRFPDKESLVLALFENAFDEIAALASTALENPSSWEGLTWFMEQAFQRQGQNRALHELLVGSDLVPDETSGAKKRLEHNVEKLIQRAQRDGYIRKDVVGADIAVMGIMITSFCGAINHDAPLLWRRYMAIILDGLVVSRDTVRPLGPTPDFEMVMNAVKKDLGRTAGKCD